MLLRRDQIRILARNETVMQGLKENYKSLTKDKVELPVFCVSNSVYMDHVRGYDFSQPPPLSLQDTDIPRLREYLYALPSKGKFATLQHYCSGLLMGVLNTMELSCSVSKLKRQDNLDQIVHQAHLVSWFFGVQNTVLIYYRLRLPRRMQSSTISPETQPVDL